MDFGVYIGSATLGGCGLLAGLLRWRYPSHRLGRPPPSGKLPVLDLAPQEVNRFKSRDGLLLNACWWKGQGNTPPPPRAVVLIVHGFGEHSELYDVLGRALLTHNVWAMGVDLRGFGRSQGHGCFQGQRYADAPNSYSQDVEDAVHQCLSELRESCQRFPDENQELPPLFLFGHSLGAGAVIELLEREPSANVETQPGTEPLQTAATSIRGVILSGVGEGGDKTNILKMPVVRWGFHLLYNLVPDMKVGEIDPKDMTRSVAYHQRVEHDQFCLAAKSFRVGYIKNILDAEDRDGISEKNGCKKVLRLASALVLYGSEDRFCSEKGARQIFEDIESEDKEFASFDGFFHNLVHEPTPEDASEAAPVHFICEWILGRI